MSQKFPFKYNNVLLIAFIYLIILLLFFFSFEYYLSYSKFYLTTEEGKADKLEEKKKYYRDILGKEYLVTDRRNEFVKQRKEHKKISISFIPEIKSKKIDFALSGISHAHTLLCNENGYLAYYLSDRYGFNNKDEYWDEEIIDFFLVGDSFLQGQCVNRPNDISSNIINLTKKNVLNVAYGGTGPLIHHFYLREYLKPKVKNIIMFYYEGNDLPNLEGELNYNSESYLKYLNDINYKQNLKNHHHLIDFFGNKQLKNYLKNKTTEKNTKFSLDFKKLIKLHELRYRIFNNEMAYNNLLYEKFKSIMNLNKILAEKNNSKLYFVYLPDYNRYATNKKFKSYNNIKNIIKNLDINFIDVHEGVFNKLDDPLSLFPYGGGHYNEEGYKKISEYIIKSNFN